MDEPTTDLRRLSLTKLKVAWRAGTFPFRPQEGLLVGAVTATVQFLMAFKYGIAEETDFAIFLRTTERFLDGLQMYSGRAIDFTPPVFHAFLFPLAHIDPRIGFVLWTAANVGLAWIVLRMVLQAVPDAWTQRWLIAAWVANAAGVQMTVRLGQVSWLTALLVTCAWKAARTSRPVAAGVWAGLAIAFKPFLLVVVPVFIVRRQWRALAACVPTIFASMILSLLLFGIRPMEDWLGNLRAIPDPGYVTHFLNASSLAVVARASVPLGLGMLLAAVTIVAMLWRVRSSDEDRAWLLLGLAALLASPLGWIYYQPMLLGPGVAMALSGRFTHLRWIAVASVAPGLSSTLFQQGSVVVALTLGSIYTWGLLAAFVGLLRPSLEAAVSQPQAPTPIRSITRSRRRSPAPSPGSVGAVSRFIDSALK